MTTTLLLDRDNWDLCLSTTGDLAIASAPYSQAQDIASECRLFAGEAWYDTARGIAYFSEVLGQFQPVQLLKQQLVNAATRVPGVAAVRVYLDAIDGRSVTGQVQFSTDQGQQVLTL